MAEKEFIHPRNVGGRYFVDDTCIDCDLCRSEAPETFARDDEGGGQTFVYRQPTLPKEVELAEWALEHCPTSSIGNDGG